MAFPSYTGESVHVTRFSNILHHSGVTIRSGLPPVDPMFDGRSNLILLSQSPSALVKHAEPIRLLLVE
jgi:hypothetical protein